ncbi:uroporphyrinogen decarboxylase family protein [candidate division KSB1 bacterium]
MTSKERVLKTLEFKEPDRVPIAEWGIDHDISEGLLGRKTFWRSKAEITKALWDGRRDEVVGSFKNDLIEIIDKLDHDLIPAILVPPKGLKSQRIKKLDDETWEDGFGQIWKYSAGSDCILLLKRPVRNVSSVEDIHKLFESEIAERCGFRIKDKDGNRYDLELDDESRLEVVRHVVKERGDTKFIFGRGFEEANGSMEPLYFTEFEEPWIFFGGGEDNYYMNIALQPDLVKEASDLCAQMNLATAKIFIDEGVDAIAPGGDFSSSTGPMISPNTLRKIYLPGMKEVSNFGHNSGVKVLTHNCGNNWKILDMLIETGYDAWQSIQSKTADMDMKRLKKMYGNKIALWGGINIESLYDGTAEENMYDVLYALKYAGVGGGLIAGTSNSVAFGVSYDNYMTCLDTLHKFGDYPLRIEEIDKRLSELVLCQQ